MTRLFSTMGLYIVILNSLEQALGMLEHVCIYDDYLGRNVNMEAFGYCGKTLTELIIAKCGGITYLQSDKFPFTAPAIRRK